MKTSLCLKLREIADFFFPHSIEGVPLGIASLKSASAFSSKWTSPPQHLINDPAGGSSWQKMVILARSTAISSLSKAKQAKDKGTKFTPPIHLRSSLRSTPPFWLVLFGPTLARTTILTNGGQKWWWKTGRGQDSSEPLVFRARQDPVHPMTISLIKDA